MRTLIVLVSLLIAVPAHAFFVTIGWTPDPINEELAFGYKIYYGNTSHPGAHGPTPSAGPAFPYDFVYTTSNPRVSQTTIDDLPGGFWCFRVTAWNAVHETVFSHEVCAEIQEDTFLNIPSGVNVEEIGR